MPRRDDYDNYDRYGEGDDDRPPARRPGPEEDEEDDGYDDYDRPRRPRRRAAALERVSLPAIFLMVLGGLGVLMALFSLVVVATGMNNPNPFVNPQQAQDPAFQAGEKVGRVLAPIIRFLWAGIVLFGGIQMKNLKSRGFVVFSCIWAMLPCNECCLLGLPFGIWALVVLNDETVKRAF